MYQVHDIKSFQCVCNTKAGLAVCSERGMSKYQIEQEVFEEFKMALETLGLPHELDGVDRQILLWSKNFIVKVCKIDNYHDGESILRKFGEIKRVVVNDFTDLCMKNLPSGQLSSGKLKMEIIEKTRKDVFLRQELAKNPQSTDICPTTWFPKEWHVFLIFGAASDKPVPIFYPTSAHNTKIWSQMLAILSS